MRLKPERPETVAADKAFALRDEIVDQFAALLQTAESATSLAKLKRAVRACVASKVRRMAGEVVIATRRVETAALLAPGADTDATDNAGGPVLLLEGMGVAIGAGAAARVRSARRSAPSSTTRPAAARQIA
jgi:hypothetical protein